MSIGSLKQNTAKSILWVTIDSLGQRILQFIIGIILARLLLPEEFGLIGLITVFISFSSLFIDSGFSFTLIRKKEVDDIEYTTVFWFNLIISILFYLLLFLASDLIADFYKNKLLSNLTKAIGLILIINAVGSIQNIRLRKDLNFKAITIIGVVSKIISGSVAITMAFKGYGVWCLVVQQLLVNIVKVSLMLWYNWFFPKLQFSFVKFKELLAFSSRLLYGGIVHTVVHNIYPIVIGKMFSIGDVGFFNRAKGLQDLPVMFFTGIVQQVTLPTFSLIQDEEERFINTYRKAIKATLFMVLLPLVIIVITAYPLIEILLTDKWLPAAPMLQILALGGIFYPVSALNVNIIGIKGRSDYVMILQFIKDGMAILGVIIGSFFGIHGLVWSFAITSNISFLLNIHFTSKVVSYSMHTQLKDIFSILLLGFSIGFFVYYITSFMNTDKYMLLLIQFIFVSFLYITISWGLKMHVLKDTLSMFSHLIHQKK